MKKKCPPKDISLKSYFLGPQAENGQFLQSAFLEIVSQYCHWRQSLFPADGQAISSRDQLHPQFLRNQKSIQILMETLSKDFQNEIPQFSPRYLGHMFSELTLPGLLGHFVALLHNPNNISKESSKVGLTIESEAIQALGSMFKWPHTIGHLTSGGTVANLEALLRMRHRIPFEKRPQAKLLTSTAAHYSWKKNLKILGYDESALIEVPLDRHGRLCPKSLAKIISKTNFPILGMVSLFGSTERGTVDNIQAINQVLKVHRQLKIWHHVDAAYGGFFACSKYPADSFLGQQVRALRSIDSLTLDPHKLGYVPYGCGAFLCRNSKNYFYSDVEAPYIQFKSAQEAGVQSVEGSRPATGAAAMWLTAKTIGLDSRGLGRILNRHLETKSKFQKLLSSKVKNIVFTEGLDLNILCWTMKTGSQRLSEANKNVDRIFESFPKSSSLFYVSKTSLPLKKNRWLEKTLVKKGFKIDSSTCHLVRMTLMNPFLMSRETKTSYPEDFIKSLRKFI
ncbi:MAG: aspartate aminotransferase family protein [Bdellovibrionaceae bacterium]|nr:aspartate aminotransferase family protein [Pseudobdellovibrionaceae bacterium]